MKTALDKYLYKQSEFNYCLDRLNKNYLIWFICSKWGLFSWLNWHTHVTISSKKWRELYEDINQESMKKHKNTLWIPSWNEFFECKNFSKKAW